jgi:hypoxanthine phosphoribosyltransferase
MGARAISGGEFAVAVAPHFDDIYASSNSLERQDILMALRVEDVGHIEVIFSAEAIANRIDALAREIALAKLDRLLVIPVLKGSFVFAADLIRALHRAGLQPEVDFISLASYGKSTKSSGSVEILRDIETNVEGRNVLLVDDILESGRTLAFAKDLVVARGARRIATCVLLNKQVRRAVRVEADFCAFQCPEVFVVGYGMDFAHRFRELPFVGHVVKN